MLHVVGRARGTACVRFGRGFEFLSAILRAEIIDMTVIDGGFGPRGRDCHAADTIDILCRRSPARATGRWRRIRLSAVVAMAERMSHDMSAASETHHEKDQCSQRARSASVPERQDALLL